MIKIFVWKKNGDGVKRLLYLSPDTTITMKIRNPLVNDQGTFSYPLHLNYEKNNHIFDFPADGEGEVKKFAFEMWVGSDFFFEGDVEIIDAHGIEVYLKSGNSSVSNILQNSYMDEAINGHSWGESSLDNEEIFNTTQGHFPTYNFVVFPVKADDFMYNQSVSYNRAGIPTDAHEASLCPAVYVRYLINKIINALGFVKGEDQISTILDINRLVLWAGKQHTDISQYNTWLPHVPTMSFLKALQKTFTIFLYFSPVSRYCDVILLQNIFTLAPRKWDEKLIEDVRSDRYAHRTLLFTHQGSGDAFISPTSIYPDPNHIYSTFGELPDRNYYPSETVATVRGVLKDLIARVGTAPPYRYFKNTHIDPDNFFSKEESNRILVTEGLYLQPDTVEAGAYYKIATGVPDSTPVEKSNTVTTHNVDNLIAQFLLDIEEGEITQFFALTIHAKVDSGNSNLKIYLVRQTQTPSGYEDEEIIAADQINLTNTAYELHKSIFRIRVPSYLIQTGSRNSQNKRSVLKLYSRSSATRTITVRFGGIDDTKPFPVPAYIMIDPRYYEWREIGALGDYLVGENKEADETFDSPALILANDYAFYEGLREMPVTDMKPDPLQSNFAFTFYRGIRKELTLPYEKQGGFASFDTVGIDQHAYALEGIWSPPFTSLRWSEEGGIINRFMENFLFNKRFRWRSVTKKLSLSSIDISYTPLYHPIVIDSQVYIISELSVPIHVTKGIGETTAELFTI